jgi:hypothetical protein
LNKDRRESTYEDKDNRLLDGDHPNCS